MNNEFEIYIVYKNKEVDIWGDGSLFMFDLNQLKAIGQLNKVESINIVRKDK